MIPSLTDCSNQNTMDDEPDAYDSSEGKMEFQGRGRELGEWQCAEIVENEDLADHEDLPEHEAAIDPDRREFQLAFNLPPVPAFEPYKHTQPRHDRILHLPTDLDAQPLRPLHLFMLFFDQEQFEELARNTNSYATTKEAGRNGERRWYAVKGAEVMIFVGLVIYMGIYHSSAVTDYWRKDGLSPLHKYIFL